MIVSVFYVILFCLYASVYLCSSQGTYLPQNVSAVLFFGDSFFDTGNNNYVPSIGKVNFLPYGRDFMGGKPTGRYSNGKNLADFFAEGLGVKEFVPPYLDPSLNDSDLLTGVSFASGGSGYDPQTARRLTAIPIMDQLDFFKSYVGNLTRIVGAEATMNILDTSVSLISLGTNDIIVSLPDSNSENDVLNYVRNLVNLALGVIRRKNDASQLFNSMLKEQLPVLANSLPQSTVAYVDFYNPLITVIDNPGQYGIHYIQ
ncbi:hypothetical protein L2E82_36275 [Cichorium intybus]|uniref:Uncharacterized protein n=1 Tax=Cichorium intybus TaxID=13427 RepID=A0ACB9BR95_CICIN|nr:hypothetical protein L2E82_36275 [Cichorium intybus]